MSYVVPQVACDKVVSDVGVLECVQIITNFKDLALDQLGHNIDKSELDQLLFFKATMRISQCSLVNSNVPAGKHHVCDIRQVVQPNVEVCLRRYTRKGLPN